MVLERQVAPAPFESAAGNVVSQDDRGQQFRSAAAHAYRRAKSRRYDRRAGMQTALEIIHLAGMYGRAIGQRRKRQRRMVGRPPQ